MTEHVWLKIVGIAGTIIPVGGALIGLGIYVGNLTNQIEASRSEVQVLKGQVSQLQDILQRTQSAAGSAARGPQGPKGEPGDAGPQGMRGERGPQGEQGPVGPASAASAGGGLTEQQVRQIIQQQLASSPSSPAGAVNVTLNGQDVFNASGCIPIDSIRGLDVLTLRSGNEFCDRTGRVIFRVTEIRQSDGRIYFMTPGKGSGSCFIDKKCTFDDLGKTFVYERRGSDDNGAIALFRITK